MNQHNIPGMLTKEEISTAQATLKYTLSRGASGVRINVNKSLLDLYGMLDGGLDKVTHALDRSLSLNLFVDGRYGTFSTNRISEVELRTFVDRAIETVRMLAPDPARALPSPDRTAKDAATGRELGLYDPAYETLSAPERLRMARSSSIWDRRSDLEEGFTIISEEGEYSDSLFDSLTIDSNGLFCRHTETSFEIGYEVTVQDKDGNRYSGYWWDATPMLKDLKINDCSATAIKRAAAQIGPQSTPGGRYTLVVDSECSAKLITPVLNALSAFAIQQKNSFLTDRLGEKVFSDRLTVMDMPRDPGQTGSRLFDSEGIATRETPIIDRGVISEYFVNTYMSNKMGIAPTIEDAIRPKILHTDEDTTLDDLLRRAGSGILVTGFNGGNSNSSTGDFSYGIEGFAFSGGVITHPVREMLITGNFIKLWNNFLGAADDARPGKAKPIPSLAFTDVDFSS
ncbi:MAG: TldD/PmbA family protein [Bacteroidales bacterium]|nr:TldD/PmbA family protein [Bacteroidales bacterium]